MSDPDKDPAQEALPPKSARSRRRVPVIGSEATEATPPEAMAEPIAEVAPAGPLPEPEPAPDALAIPEVEPAIRVSPEPTALEPPPPETPAPEPQPEPLAVPPPPPPGPSMAMPLALAALAGALGGGLAGVVGSGLGSGANPGSTAPLAALEQKQSELAARLAALPNPAEIDRLRQAAARIETETAKRISDANAALGQKIAGLEAELKALAGRPTSPDASVSAAPPVDLSPLRQRIDSLETELKGLAAIAEAAGKTAEAAGKSAEAAAKAADPKLAALDQKLGETIRRVDAGSAAPLFSAVQGLAQAFHRGAPMASELAAVEALGAKPEQLAALKPFAEKGAPTPQSLAASFAPLAGSLASGANEGGITGFVQRFVTIRPTSDTGGNSPAALVGAIEAALKRGDVPAALAAWNRLPEPARQQSAAWGKLATDQDAAARALAALQNAAAAALRK
ncbi:MAG: hypothetical protein IOC90_14635 [Methylocystis sp.]|nr:hypothetical protein [Methylocystis sp.]MCA3585277.1 hypothetical protein [Methylocystis sp.]MCA3589250.1 hypothetical protein [Methylocystis sp.]MCA3591624.1 hypothetical protein [Methylocystis sp.]